MLNTMMAILANILGALLIVLVIELIVGLRERTKMVKAQRLKLTDSYTPDQLRLLGLGF